MQEPGRELGIECLDRRLEEAGSEGAEEERSQQTPRSAVREGRRREGKWIREHGHVVGVGVGRQM